MRAEVPLAAPDVPSRRAAIPLPAVWGFFAALGPGVIGLTADNDAGGMLSYLITGAAHTLRWTLPALGVMGAVTLIVLLLAQRVQRATSQPYTRVLTLALGRPLALTEALALYGMNGFILVTEFLGMTLALGAAGVPRLAALPVTFALVALLTGARFYGRIEALLLRTSLVSLAFVPALLLLHPGVGAWATAFGSVRTDPWFLLLAMSGNAMAPWMIYWQQDAAWAGKARSARQQFWDVGTGVAAMIVLASTVLLLGALTPAGPAVVAPVAWLLHSAGRLPGTLFALGLFNAGLLAACTVSLSSLWTLREALSPGRSDRRQAPNRGRWLVPHLGTLAAAAAVAGLPDLAAGRVALWANAVPALWMPVSLLLLGLVLRNRRLMGRHAIGAGAQALLGAIIALFLGAACVGLAH